MQACPSVLTVWLFCCFAWVVGWRWLAVVGSGWQWLAVVGDGSVLTGPLAGALAGPLAGALVHMGN